MPVNDREAGVTLVGVVVAGVIMTIAVCGLVSAMLQSGRLSRTSRSTIEAALLARHVVETIRACSPDEVLPRYNADPLDDPDGPGTAPGSTFPIQTRGGEAFVEVRFPDGGVPGCVREDVTDPPLGLPRDLNGDGTIDSIDHSADYRLLPVRIRLHVDDPSGRRTTEILTLLARR